MTPRFTIEEDWSGWALRDNAPSVADIGECVAGGANGDVEEGWLEIFSYDPADGPLTIGELARTVGATLEYDDLFDALDVLQKEGKIAVTATASDEYGPDEQFAALARGAYENTTEDEYNIQRIANDSDEWRIANGVITEAEAVLALLVHIAIDSESEATDADIAGAIVSSAAYLDRRDIKWTSGR